MKRLWPLWLLGICFALVVDYSIFHFIFQKPLKHHLVEQSIPHQLNVGVIAWPGYQPLRLAEVKKFFTDPGIKIRRFSSPNQVINGFQSGQIQAAAMTLGDAINLRQFSPQVRVILILDFSNGGDAIVAQQDIHTMNMLKGKRLALENTLLSTYLLHRALSLHQMNVDDFHLIPLAVDQHKDAFVNQQVDAIVTYEPTLSEIKHLGGVVVFDSKEIPNEIIDVLVIHQEFANAHPELVADLQNGWFKALKFLAEDRNSAVELIAQELRLPTQKLHQSLQNISFHNLETNHLLLQSSNSDLSITVRQLSNIMLRKGITRQEITYEELFDSTYLP